MNKSYSCINQIFNELGFQCFSDPNYKALLMETIPFFECNRSQMKSWRFRKFSSDLVSKTLDQNSENLEKKSEYSDDYSEEDYEYSEEDREEQIEAIGEHNEAIEEYREAIEEHREAIEEHLEAIDEHREVIEEHNEAIEENREVIEDDNEVIEEQIEEPPLNIRRRIVGHLHFNKQEILNNANYRLNAIERMLQQPPQIHKHYQIKENLEAVECMKTMNIWPALAFPEIKGYGSAIARHFGIKERTVRNWIDRLQKDPSWEGPLRKTDPNTGFVLTRDQEKLLTSIVLDYTQKHHQRMNSTKFKELAQKFVEDHRIVRKWNFNCSHKWIAKFKVRNRLSTRRGHLKRRPTASQEDIDNYRQKVLDIMQTAEHDHIINVDESPWHSDENALTTWAVTGSEDIVLYGDQKTCFTFIGSMNAENQLLPPIFLSSGTTVRLENNWFEEAHPVQQWSQDKEWRYLTDHTPSGWTTKESWVRYLDFLRKYIPNDPQKSHEKNKIYVICDIVIEHIFQILTIQLIRFLWHLCAITLNLLKFPKEQLSNVNL